MFGVKTRSLKAQLNAVFLISRKSVAELCLLVQLTGNQSTVSAATSDTASGKGNRLVIPDLRALWRETIVKRHQAIGLRGDEMFVRVSLV